MQEDVVFSQNVEKLKELLYNQAELSPSKEKVLFYLPVYSYFVNSISPLIYKYLQSDKECVMVIPGVEVIAKIGEANINDMVKIIDNFLLAGGKCYIEGEKKLCCNEYVICFLCSEYSGRLPLELRKVSRYVVAVQVTALYTHMYLVEGRFEQVFSEQSRKEIDYVVTSEYIADWICKRDNKWKGKILRMGYPKMDALYHSLNRYSNVPKEWKDKIAGRKVYLFTTYNMEQTWLDFFSVNKNAMIAIWRPHPLLMETPEEYENIKRLSESYNIIIDEMPTYDVSFQISDAMIGSLDSSVVINYLYMEKPVCLFCRQKLYQNAVMDYREELWYKCSYNVSDIDQVLEFIKRVELGEVLITKEQETYRKCLKTGFDGAVCNRIFEYFEQIFA